jgi:hypothetical protein
VRADIKISVNDVEETNDPIVGSLTRLHLEWKAAKIPQLFPLMKGELALYALTKTETQLDFSGVYEPPFGALGKTMNAMAGHRIAEASVHRFVGDIAAYLRQAIK